jgi:hypothetical protein
MMRGTFANIRLRNILVPGTEGGLTVHWPDGKRMTIYDALITYQAEKVALIVIAGVPTTANCPSPPTSGGEDGTHRHCRQGVWLRLVA